jgi:hypothetical protein
VLEFEGPVWSWSRLPAEGRRVLDRQERIRKTRYFEPFMVLELCSALGDRERLKLWVNRADQERCSALFLLQLDPGAHDFIAQAH